MKIKHLLVGLALISNAVIKAQSSNDSLGLPGDNFDLYGALELFKQSSSSENFEKAINTGDSNLNNLDLNNDGEVDYVKVVDRSTNSDKILILQAIISEHESQDIAVIEMEKKGDASAAIQIIGDEALYGKDYIIEPIAENSNSDKVADKPSPNRVVFVNVWGWSGVNWLYGPTYQVWISPYHWRAYPVWWTPWHPLRWHLYHPRVHVYHHPYYHRTNFYVAPHLHKVYYGQRTTSTIVINKTKNGNVRSEQKVNRGKANPKSQNNSVIQKRGKANEQRMQDQRNTSRPEKRANTAPAKPRNQGSKGKGAVKQGHNDGARKQRK